MAVAEILGEASNWTPSSRVLLSLDTSLVRLSMPRLGGAAGVLEIGSQEVPRVLREASEIAERALAMDAAGKFTANTPSESHRIVWAPNGVFIGAGLGMAVASPDAEGRRFTVQSTPISFDPTPRIIERIKEVTRLSHKAIAELVGVSRQSVNNWQRKQPIASDNRRRLLAVLDIFDRARRRYPTRSQLSTWLHTPCTAAGKTPAELILAGDYDQARYCAVARPTPGVRPLPGWATRSIPDKFAGSVRSRREGSPAEPSPQRTRRSEDE